MADETDIRKFGGLKHEMWHTWATFGIATIAITGVLPLSGFFSKDAILHAALDGANPWFGWLPLVVYLVGLAAALGTAFYMWRMFHLTFEGKRRGLLEHHAHESGPAMTGPLWILAGLAVGALVWGLPTGDGVTGFQRFLEPVFGPAEAGRERMFRAWADAAHAALPEAAVSFTWGSMLPGYVIAWLVALAGFGVATWMYLGAGKGVPERIATGAPGLYAAFARKFYVDEFYDLVIVRPLRFLAFVLWRVVDALAIDKILVEGPALVTGWIAQVFRYFQNGNVQRYAAVMALSAVVLFWVIGRLVL